MFSPSDLQALIEKTDGGQQGVDLVKIGQNFAQQGLIIRTNEKNRYFDTN